MGTESEQVLVVEMRRVVRGDRLLFFCGNMPDCLRANGRLYGQTRLLASTALIAPAEPVFTAICPRCHAFNALDLEAVARAMTKKT